MSLLFAEIRKYFWKFVTKWILKVAKLRNYFKCFEYWNYLNFKCNYFDVFLFKVHLKRVNKSQEYAKCNKWSGMCEIGMQKKNCKKSSFFNETSLKHESTKIPLDYIEKRKIESVLWRALRWALTELSHLTIFPLRFKIIHTNIIKRKDLYFYF